MTSPATRIRPAQRAAKPAYIHPLIQRLAADRAARGLPRRVIAERMGCAPQTVWHYEVGLRQPDPDALTAYAAALGYDLTLTPRTSPPTSKETRVSIFRRNRTQDPAPHTPAAPTPPPPFGKAPANSLEEVQQAAPALVSLYKAAGVSLEKKGLAGTRAAVYLVMDRSGSMRPYYQERRGRTSHMQHFAEQALGLSANLDDDGTVPLVFFDHGAFPVVEVGLDSYQGRVGAEHQKLGHMGGTDYATAMRAVADHYRASNSRYPAFVIFQTDGATADEGVVKDLLRGFSRDPIFWQFVGFGPAGSPDFDFLRGLDKLSGRHLDNAGFVPAGVDPAALSDEALFDKLMGEFPKWLAAARTAGILP
ncbi:VWA domain-containing protein [Actinomadura sp. LOL_016]|uniref:VWA domain-containing protein n=1 Tax=unclassified Actinomadura TaxID=2626254 RepID=UPI003A7FDC1D